MKFKELLPRLIGALIITIALQYFFAPGKSEDITDKPRSGQRFTAPRVAELQNLKPLNTEVDFLDKARGNNPITTSIATEHARYEFSSDGATLERVEFKRNWGGNVGYLNTLATSSNKTERDQGALLVALDQKTPYYFDLIEKKEEDDRWLITYKADFGDGVLYKTFEIYKNVFRIDLDLIIEPRGAQAIQPRIIFPSPIVPELCDKDTIMALANDEKNKIQMLAKDEQLLKEYWVKPTLFGSQDRYFVHALVADNNEFVERGYYMVRDLEALYAVLEGPAIAQKSSWKLSFYFGPKEDAALIAVDSRLQQTLNYGMLAFISRPVSKVMLLVLNYLYDFTKNYGFAIILLTLLMRLILVPFTFGAEKSREKQAEFQKKLKHLENKYKDDKQALAEARAELIRKYGMPGLGGCLPLLVQIPLFIALGWVLSNSIELYMAPFFWISDLSAPDPLYILPTLIGLSMIFNVPGVDPKQKVTSLVIAVLIGTFTVNLSAGLALYIFVSTVFAGLQTYIAKRFA